MDFYSHIVINNCFQDDFDTTTVSFQNSLFSLNIVPNIFFINHISIDLNVSQRETFLYPSRSQYEARLFMIVF